MIEAISSFGRFIEEASFATAGDAEKLVYPWRT